MKVVPWNGSHGGGPLEGIRWKEPTSVDPLEGSSETGPQEVPWEVQLVVPRGGPLEVVPWRGSQGGYPVGAPGEITLDGVPWRVNTGGVPMDGVRLWGPILGSLEGFRSRGPLERVPGRRPTGGPRGCSLEWAPGWGPVEGVPLKVPMEVYFACVPWRGFPGWTPLAG
jgi:hypothetical protein